MKSITLKTTVEKVVNRETGKELNFVINTTLLIRSAVNNNPSNGFNATDMADRLKILAICDEVQEQVDKEVEDKQKEINKLEAEIKKDKSLSSSKLKLTKEITKSTDKSIIIKFEDALFKKLGEYVKVMTWAFVSQTIVDFDNLFNER